MCQSILRTLLLVDFGRSLANQDNRQQGQIPSLPMGNIGQESSARGAVGIGKDEQHGLALRAQGSESLSLRMQAHQPKGRRWSPNRQSYPRQCFARLLLCLQDLSMWQRACMLTQQEENEPRFDNQGSKYGHTYVRTYLLYE